MEINQNIYYYLFERWKLSFTIINISTTDYRRKKIVTTDNLLLITHLIIYLPLNMIRK